MGQSISTCLGLRGRHQREPENAELLQLLARLREANQEREAAERGRVEAERVAQREREEREAAERGRVEAERVAQREREEREAAERGRVEAERVAQQEREEREAAERGRVEAERVAQREREDREAAERLAQQEREEREVAERGREAVERAAEHRIALDRQMMETAAAAEGLSLEDYIRQVLSKLQKRSQLMGTSGNMARHTLAKLRGHTEAVISSQK
eukprot:tig00020710_g13333.t2